MQLYSTNNRQHLVNLKEAVFRGLPPDNGLYMPVNIPKLPDDFLNNLGQYSFAEIGFEVCKHLFQGAIPEKDLKEIVYSAINFPAPIVSLDHNTFILELFHGPSLAFKDFGARFMARLMSYFNQGEDKELIILVATSGDTGGAVAAGFQNTPGIKVVILYPSGKVSPLQEKQLTTLGGNITALEVDGTFDDCQTLVKQAFLDPGLTSKIRLSSANSINISRLVPQSFYYFQAYKQLPDHAKPAVFCIPSGNFGNLTAGLLAARMGLPVQHFIAATNVNDVVPVYLDTGNYKPRPSQRTISNAMDVGNPSNFARMLDLYGSDDKPTLANMNMVWEGMKDRISGYGITDKQTKQVMLDVFQLYNYVIDPHAAVGYLALRTWQKEQLKAGVILETAHPTKFLADVEEVLNSKIEVPNRLAVLADLPKDAINMGISYLDFKSFLTENFS